ncbi:hypothetical protein LDENG_00154750, partial [Lucifuga dentata]
MPMRSENPARHTFPAEASSNDTNLLLSVFSGSRTNPITMATEEKKPETDTKPPVIPSASSSQSK